jgi:hypothetical protein
MLHALCYLTVARQPAIDVDILLIMTFQAHPHPPIFVRQPLQVLNLPVAFPAGYLVVDMPLVVEQYMFRYIVNFDPGCRCLSVEIFMLFLDLRVFFDDIVMAVQTLFHRRNAREIGIGNIGVAILALDLLDATVHIVAEGDRLFRAESVLGPHPKNIDKSG